MKIFTLLQIKPNKSSIALHHVHPTLNRFFTSSDFKLNQLNHSNLKTTAATATAATTTTLSEPKKLTLSKRLFVTLETLLSKEKRLARRNELRKQIREGQFKEIHEFKEKGGKYFTASAQLIPAEDAPVFPSIQVHSLVDDVDSVDLSSFFSRHPVSILSLSLSELASKDLESFLDPLRSSLPNIPIYQFSSAHTWIYLKILQFNRTRLRHLVPVPEHYFISTTPGFPSSLTSLIPNKHLGYVFLMDQHARIRWHAHGKAKPEELEACMQVLRDLQRSKP